MEQRRSSDFFIPISTACDFTCRHSWKVCSNIAILSIITRRRHLNSMSQNSYTKLIIVIDLYFLFEEFFVVMRITPLAALAPYMAVEEASLRISIFSISLALILRISDVIIPSTIYNGSAPPKTEPTPRILTFGVLPGAPLLMIDTPAALPCIACDAVKTGSCEISEDFIFIDEPVISDFLLVP